MTKTALYRHYDADGALLYVGASGNSFRRLLEHERTKEWAEKVARIELEWFDDAVQAFMAEKAAIAAEKPLHNVMHTATEAGGGPRRAMWERFAERGLSMKEAAKEAGVTYQAARKAASRYGIQFRRHEYGDAA